MCVYTHKCACAFAWTLWASEVSPIGRFVWSIYKWGNWDWVTTRSWSNRWQVVDPGIKFRTVWFNNLHPPPSIHHTTVSFTSASFSPLPFIFVNRAVFIHFSSWDQNYAFGASSHFLVLSFSLKKKKNTENIKWEIKLSLYIQLRCICGNFFVYIILQDKVHKAPNWESKHSVINWVMFPHN